MTRLFGDENFYVGYESRGTNEEVALVGFVHGKKRSYGALRDAGAALELMKGLEGLARRNNSLACGHWTLVDVQREESYECSVCHRLFVWDENRGCESWGYCPNCGAKMDGDSDD